MFEFTETVRTKLLVVIVVVVLIGCSHTITTLQQAEQSHVPITPVYERLNPETPIFFMVRDESRVHNRPEGVIQIWQITVDGTTSWPFIELPIRYPAIALPLQELAILEHNLCFTEQEQCSVEGIDLSYSLDDLRLSPNKQILAWGDGASWCPNTRCYGFQRLMIWDVTKGEIKTLLEISNHIDLRVTQYIDGIAWSPDSKQIGFVQASNDNGWSRVRVVDVATQQIRDIGEGRAPITWALDGEHLAFISYSWDDVRIASSDGISFTTFGGDWEKVEGIDWSPNGSQIAITAATDYEQARHDLFVADLVAGDITKVEIPTNELFDYTQPRWSPDGRLIGVNARRNGDEIISDLVILDLKDQTVKANLIIKRYYPEWSWSNTGSAILVRLGSSIQALPPHTPQRIGIFYWMNGTLEQVSFPENIENGLDNWRLYLSEPVW